MKSALTFLLALTLVGAPAAQDSKPHDGDHGQEHGDYDPSKHGDGDHSDYDPSKHAGYDPSKHGQAHDAGGPPKHWSESEASRLVDHVQLTFRDDYFRAGEGYFSADGTRVVYQAVPAPAEGEVADEFYAMYVADVVRTDGRVSGLANPRRISPLGSANTCGWFHPHDSSIVFFACTVEPPTQEEAPGYQRGSGRYKWQFPPQMRVVKVDLRGSVGTAEDLELVVGDRAAYQAEGALDPSGKNMVFGSLATGGGDLWSLDLETGRTVPLVQMPGYDGGPFFSPDGKRICYRSDRRGDNLLQLFVAELAFDARGKIIGVEREYQLTDNAHVNWAPFWHPSGRFLVYATSEVGHHNYEIFAIDADSGHLPGSSSAGTTRYGTRKRRISEAAGADVLPVFSADGGTMMWTSKRGEHNSSQLWAATFVMDLDAGPTGSH